jgi:hypothetical protein
MVSRAGQLKPVASEKDLTAILWENDQTGRVRRHMQRN